MKKKTFFSLVTLLIALAVGAWFWSYATSPVLAQVTQPQIDPGGTGTGGGACATIGNNLAYPASQSPNVDYAEAQYTLAILNGREDQRAIVDAINSGNTVIIRIGGSKENWGPNAADYVTILKEISAATGNKPFVATASHNEANCAENQGPGTKNKELAFANAVATGLSGVSNITLITGQIDHYCGTPTDAPSIEWARDLSAIPGISGVALPYYITPGTPTATATFTYFQDFVSQLGGEDIYVTESGPFLDNSMSEFTKAVDMLYRASLVKTMLLFNALGINQDAAFQYTSPFWSPACREAFRTSCNDPAKVLQICGEGLIPAGYYLYPIAGLDKVHTYNENQQVIPQTQVSEISGEIFTDLADQGYQAYCTTPTFNIKGGQEGDITAFRKWRAPGTGVFDITSSLRMDTSKGNFPLFRSKSGSPTLMNSLETYWGYQDPDTSKSMEERALNSAAIYKLLTIEQQCEQKIAILKSINAMCNKLEDPNNCALYQPIPGVRSASTRTMLQDFETTGLTCADVGQGKIPESDKGTVEALMNTPLYLDKAYRLAFLVVNVPLQEYQPTVYFNFLRIPNPAALFSEGSSRPANEVRVLAFRIPDIGTNKNPDDPGFYEDPLQLTNNILSTPQNIDARYLAQKEAKDALKSGGDSGRIQCSVLPGDLENQSACQDPLSKAVIDVVNKQPEVLGPVLNGQWLPCDQASEDTLKYEESSAIYTDASLNGKEGDLTEEDQETLNNALSFKPGFNLIKSLFSIVTGQQETPQTSEFNFISRLDLHKDGGADSKVQMYLVYPVGYELKDVESTLAGLILGPDELEAYRNDPDLEQYFRMSDIEAAFTSEAESVEFYDPDKCAAEIQSAATAVPPRLPNLANCTNRATAKVVDTASYDRQPRVLGGFLGNIMRSIQLSINTYGSTVYDYIASCETTEQFLTARCSGTNNENDLPTGEDVTGITPLAQCKFDQTGRITSGETADHDEDPSNPSCNLYVAAKHNIPNWLSSADEAKDCATLYSYVSCTYGQSLIANYVDSAGKFTTENTGETACEYVVRRAKAANISPQFALAMWGEESGFSAYDAADFGVTSQPKKNLGAQMDAFINLVNIYRSDTTTGFERFLLRYSGEGPYGAWTPGTPFCANIYFPGRLKTYYDYLGT